MVYGPESDEGKAGHDGPGIPEKADELLEAASRRGRGLLERQKDATVNELDSVAQALHQTAKELRDKQDATLGPVVEKGAGFVERFSRTLKDHDVRELLSEAQRMLKERPAAGLGVAAAVGFALGRLIRAGSHRAAEAAAGQDQE